MKIRLRLLLIGLLMPLFGFAQIESDTISGGHDCVTVATYDSIGSVFNVSYSPRYNISRPTDYPGVKYAELNIPDFSFTPGQASLYSWRGGNIAANGATATYPGLMKIDSGSLGLFHQAGRFVFTLDATATKYGYFRGVNTQYGISGSISYLITPRLSFTAFGDYFFGRPPVMPGGLPLPPSMVGFYNVSSFGGFFDYDINERFGLQVGGQGVQQIGTNRYRFEPIVTPYVKVGKISIGLPVGQIVNGIVRSYIDRKQMQRQPVGPPQMRGPNVPQPRLQRPGK